MSIELSVDGAVATILFNRPERLNALTDAMWAQLAEHLDICERDDRVRAIILTGAGRGFCAGADISGTGTSKPRKAGIAGTMETMAGYDGVIRRLYHMPKPVIAAVNGAAIGIAWTIALCCDWVLAAHGAKFRAAFLNLAKVPEGGFQFLATRLVGPLKARDLVYRAVFLSGAEAADLGLATRVVADDALMAEARALAREAAGHAPVAFALAKRLFNQSAGDFDAFLESELRVIAIAATMEDAVEGMAAFREKRPPVYWGR